MKCFEYSIFSCYLRCNDDMMDLLMEIMGGFVAPYRNLLGSSFHTFTSGYLIPQPLRFQSPQTKNHHALMFCPILLHKSQGIHIEGRSRWFIVWFIIQKGLHHCWPHIFVDHLGLPHGGHLPRDRIVTHETQQFFRSIRFGKLKNWPQKCIPPQNSKPLRPVCNFSDHHICL